MGGRAEDGLSIKPLIISHPAISKVDGAEWVVDKLGSKSRCHNVAFVWANAQTADPNVSLYPAMFQVGQGHWPDVHQKYDRSKSGCKRGE